MLTNYTNLLAKRHFTEELGLERRSKGVRNYDEWADSCYCSRRWIFLL